MFLFIAWSVIGVLTLLGHRVSKTAYFLCWVMLLLELLLRAFGG